MRRGLMSWSREELPEAVLDLRLERLQAAMRAEQLGAVLAYTSFAQPSAVHWICNFTPYWSEALLLVWPEGPPVLLASLTKRVHPWIREVSHLGEVLMAPRLGAGARDLLASRLAPGARIGVIGLDAVPWSVAEPLLQAFAQDRVVDASALFAAVRQPADAAETALACRALAMVDAALATLPAQPQRVSELTSALERSARLAGAEEVLLRIAPDLGQGTALQRMEGDAPVGPRYAAQVSLAYKGVWVRHTQSRCALRPPSWNAAEKWFATALAGMGRGTDGVLPTPPGRLSTWTLESCHGPQPLGTVSAMDRPATQALPPGSLAVFSVQLELEDGPWLCAAPLRVGGADSPSQLLDT